MKDHPEVNEYKNKEVKNETEDTDKNFINFENI